MVAADSDLTTLTVSLPKKQKEDLLRRALAAGCRTPGEYVRRLRYAAQQARTMEELEEKLLAGLESPTREMTREDWATFKRQTLARISF